ncbi:Uncharacterized conserved protein [Ceraceosorus bombacis]|uniref:Uncharacterized conserved protein n=1 Tax=Ceraceosorus bombacis TaxID=401625 RepID=A0A0N7LBA6_9BASI|nr:Uncharacterized conserved protein [Ceraceosorus bombacis]
MASFDGSANGIATPRFALEQNEDSITITAWCTPSASSSSHSADEEPRAIAEGRTFGLVHRAYYLPLVLPLPCKGVRHYSVSGDAVTVTIDKASAGFWNLEEIVPGIAPELHVGSTQRQANGGPDVISDAVSRANESASSDHRLALVDEESTTSADCVPVEQLPNDSLVRAPRVLAEARSQVHEQPWDEDRDANMRSEEAEKREDECWNEEWYLDNYADEAGEIAACLAWQSSHLATESHPLALARDDQPQLGPLHLLLIELLFAQCYDERSNQGDTSVESGWTISVLCRSLVASYLPRQTASSEQCVTAALRVSFRRALTKPLYRSWSLATVVAHDVRTILGAGSSSIRSRLQVIRDCLEEGAAGGDDAMELYVKDVIGPLAMWHESQPQESYERLAALVHKASEELTRFDVGGPLWDLDTLERAADEVLAEEER